MRQGQQANSSGQFGEDMILSVLRLKRYFPQTQYPIGLGIYGQPLKVDFYVNDAPLFPNGLIIESKYQAISGSIDEKFPYLVLNIQEHYPCPAIVVAGGGGCRPGALTWLKRQVGGNLVAVFTLEEFMVWAHRSL